MATYRGTTYTEFVGNNSPDIALVTDSSRITRELKVAGDAASWTQAVADFCGYAGVVNAGPVKYISRVTPHPFPFVLPGINPWLYAQGFPRIEGMAFKRANLDVAEYQIEKMALTYAALSYNIAEDGAVINTDALSPLSGYPDEGFALASGWDNSRYVTKNERPSAKLLVLNRGAMQFVAADITGPNPKPLLEGLPLVEPASEVQYTWHLVPAAGVPSILHKIAVGCLNDATFDFYPAQTLRLDSVETHARRDPLGNRVYDVVYRMNFLPRVGHQKGQTSANDAVHGHNWFYTGDKNTAAGMNGDLIVARVTASGLAGGTAPCRTLDFRLLFCPDQP